MASYQAGPPCCATRHPEAKTALVSAAIFSRNMANANQSSSLGPFLIPFATCLYEYYYCEPWVKPECHSSHSTAGVICLDLEYAASAGWHESADICHKYARLPIRSNSVLVTQKECSLSKCLLQVLQANGVHTTTVELPLLLLKKPLRRFSAPPLPILPSLVIIHAQHSPLGGLITKTERKKNCPLLFRHWLFLFRAGPFIRGLLRTFPTVEQGSARQCSY